MVTGECMETRRREEGRAVSGWRGRGNILGSGCEWEELRNGDDGTRAKALQLAGNSLDWRIRQTAPGMGRAVFSVSGAPAENATVDLMSPFSSNPAEARRQMSARVNAGRQGRLPTFLLDDLLRRSRAGTIARLAAAAPADSKSDLTNAGLGAARTPVDLIWRERDSMFPLSSARTAAALLPAARLTVLPDRGHAAIDCPSRFVTTLEALVRQPPPSPRNGPQ